MLVTETSKFKTTTSTPYTLETVFCNAFYGETSSEADYLRRQRRSSSAAATRGTRRSNSSIATPPRITLQNWYDRNRRILEKLRPIFGMRMHEVITFLYSLTQNSLNVIINPDAKKWQYCNVPFANDAFTYEILMDIFDSNGNLHDPFERKHLRRLMSIIRAFLSESPQQVLLSRTESNLYKALKMGKCNADPKTEVKTKKRKKLTKSKSMSTLASNESNDSNEKETTPPPVAVKPRIFYDKRQKNCFGSREANDRALLDALLDGTSTHNFDALLDLLTNADKTTKIQKQPKKYRKTINDISDLYTEIVEDKSCTSFVERNEKPKRKIRKQRNRNRNQKQRATITKERKSSIRSDDLNLNKKVEIIDDNLRASQNRKSSYITPQSASKRNSSKRNTLHTKQYYGAALPILFHEPFDPKRPATWINRYPRQMRMADNNTIQNSAIERYRRQTIDEKYQAAKERYSIYSTVQQQSASRNIHRRKRRSG